ncbi:MAG: hypothetical protein ACW976_03935 [Candidatus Ranarchaeia archaeon]
MENNQNPIDEEPKEKPGFFDNSGGFGRFSWVGKIVPAISFLFLFPVIVIITFIGQIVVFGILRPLEPLTYGALLGLFTIPLAVGFVLSIILGLIIGWFVSRQITDTSEEV